MSSKKRLVIIDKPKKTTAHLLMPDEVSTYIQDFIRPCPYLKKHKYFMNILIEEMEWMRDESENCIGVEHDSYMMFIYLGFQVDIINRETIKENRIYSLNWAFLKYGEPFKLYK